ncbi:leucine-rich repeat domain-containing protein [Rhodophyticola sp. CCM32]|uniref:leucine-rich repeat domain-containing protein n=1 Tax=Rhodophyticola sp. CCM32 TaxID=2916397 RepID=UPI00107F394F|nr:leucine-rich repeat domain-containing protein [Rhodophyticola sp. CCM32]QBX99543.1 leucine-rich repeat domain-containing protein [Rhodophyticola sp. CCM32]
MTPGPLHIYALMALLGTALGVLTACQTVSDGSNATQWRAERLAQGEATLAACMAERCSTLNLDGQSLPDYAVLASLDHVTVLMASFTDFSDLSDIAPMTQLTELHLGGTRLTELSGLDGFQRLTVLHIQDVSLNDYTPIGRLNRLEELAVGGATLTDLSFVADLPGLERLIISGAYELEDLSDLAGHPGLLAVDLGHTYATDLGALLTLPHLRQVSVADWGDAGAEAQIEALRARGVEVSYEVLLPVC